MTIFSTSYKRPKDYSRIGHTLYDQVKADNGGTPKRASLVFIGASVNWGYGLDMTQSYTYQIQSAIDTYVGKSLGGWVPRYVHTDDIMEGGPSGSPAPSFFPYNGGVSGGSYATASGWGAGINVPAAYNLNPALPGGTSYGRSKMNWNSVSGSQPLAYDAGIFGGTTYGGDKNATYTNGGIVLDSTHQGSLRWATNFTTGSTAYMQFKMTNLNGVFAVTLQLQGTSDNGSTFWTIPDWPVNYTSSGKITLNAGQTATILMAFTPTGTVSPIQQMLLTWLTATAGSGIMVEVMCPLDGAQATNHILAQVCSRNSYCLQDYTPTATDSLGRKIGDLILNGICNSPYTTPASNSKPFFVVGDTYNSMVTTATGTAGDRRLTPSQYASQLKTIGTYLQNDPSGTGNGGHIILVMPMPTQAVNGTQLNLLNGTSWNGHTLRSAAYAGGAFSSPQWQDYWQAVYNLASDQGWGFVDETQDSSGNQIPWISSGTNLSDAASLGNKYTDPMPTNHFQNDGLHPTPTGATLVANKYIAALGLSGGS